MESPDELITRFLKSSNELERYLHKNGALTPLQHQTIVTTIMGLNTLVQAWIRKHRPNEVQPEMPPFTLRKTPER